MNSQIITTESTSSFQPATGSTLPAESTGGARGGAERNAPEKKSKAQILCEEAINRLADALEAGRSDAIQQYLGVMSRFHRYSFCNQLLILAQRPESTHVAGYQRWQALGRQVCKDERAIHILAPILTKRPDPEDAQEGSSQRVCGFRVAYVFDVAQTVGEPLPSAPQAEGDPGANLEGDLEGIRALYERKGIALEYKENLDGAEGLSAKGKVYILAGLEPAREFSVLVHELAHELLHDGERRKELSRKVKETEAEAVAYAVGLSVGLDMNTASADYISLYDGDRDTLRESLESITRVASQIIAALTETKAN
ncbi:MAG: ArdC family protein [Terriglobales bacterium]